VVHRRDIFLFIIYIYRSGGKLGRKGGRQESGVGFEFKATLLLITWKSTLT